MSSSFDPTTISDKPNVVSYELAFEDSIRRWMCWVCWGVVLQSNDDMYVEMPFIRCFEECT